MHLTFEGAADFESYNKAKAWLKAHGYSIGPYQTGAPCGILYGAWMVPEWGKMSPKDVAALDGTMRGDLRTGPVYVHIKAA